jgi:two-component system phosphate regulon sensor histidine kinase PhoR
MRAASNLPHKRQGASVKRNLFLKIFFSYLVIAFLAFFVLNLLIQDEIKKVLTGKIEAELLTYAELIDLSSAREMSDQLKKIASISSSRVTLMDMQGKVFADSEKNITELENHFNRPEVQEARLRGKGISIRFSQSIGVDMLYVALPIKTDSRITGYVRLARPLHDVQVAVDKVYQSIFLAIIIVAVISLLIALFISYRLAAPIRALEKFTEKLRQGDPSGNIILQTNYLVDELQSRIRIAHEEKSKLMTAFTSMTEGIIILDAQNKIEFVNSALSNMLAIQYGDVIGKTLMEAFRNVDLQRAFLKFREVKATASQEITLGNIEPVILNVSLSAIQNPSGEEKVMVVFHDVTRLKKLEKIRVDFVANVTHEIRTPLTAIIGYLETIKTGAIDKIEDTRKFIEISLKQSQRLSRLVDDLMVISKIELGELKFHFENVSLVDALDSVVPLLEAKAGAKKIVISNKVRQDLPKINADRDRLTQILVNILDNAVKFTPEEGAVGIEAAEADNYIVLTITDTGVGVPRDEIQRLGERFYRVDRSRSRDLGGTGLGLSIVKHLMIAHGGKLEIESQLGRGTKISLFFPTQKA